LYFINVLNDGLQLAET